MGDKEQGRWITPISNTAMTCYMYGTGRERWGHSGNKFGFLRTYHFRNQRSAEFWGRRTKLSVLTNFRGRKHPTVKKGAQILFDQSSPWLIRVPEITPLRQDSYCTLNKLKMSFLFSEEWLHMFFCKLSYPYTGIGVFITCEWETFFTVYFPLSQIIFILKRYVL